MHTPNSKQINEKIMTCNGYRCGYDKYAEIVFA